MRGQCRDILDNPRVETYVENRIEYVSAAVSVLRDKLVRDEICNAEYNTAVQKIEDQTEIDIAKLKNEIKMAEPDTKMTIKVELKYRHSCAGCPAVNTDYEDGSSCNMGYWDDGYYDQRRPQVCIDNHGL